MKPSTLLGLAMLSAAFLSVSNLRAEDPANSKKRFGAFLNYLQSDIFVREGVGLKKVRLGQLFTEVSRTWGPPTRKKDRTIFGGRLWVYQADRQTEIALSGKKYVRSMAFRGTRGSPYQTSVGAHFGMQPFQISGLYGSAGLVRSNDTLEYPKKGIRFRFEKDSLRIFEVFAPKK